RSASSTALRPATWSLPGALRAPLPPPPRRGPPPEAPPLYALWAGRSSAFGVGPRPSSARRRTPPDPTVAPFLLLRTAPRRALFPAIGVSSVLLSLVSRGSIGRRPARPRCGSRRPSAHHAAHPPGPSPSRRGPLPGRPAGWRSA